MNIFADVTIIQAVTLFSVGFLGAILGGITSIIGGSKAKKAAALAESNATKQRAHELKMAQLAAATEEVSSKKTQMLVLAGGGLAVATVFLLKR